MMQNLVVTFSNIQHYVMIYKEHLNKILKCVMWNKMMALYLF